MFPSAIVGLEKDPNKRDVAAHCASVPANLRYPSADAPSADVPADVRILIEKTSIPSHSKMQCCNNSTIRYPFIIHNL
jgi:hypothetical protein